MIKSREDIALSGRIVIKAGTAVISNPDGYPSLTRMADLVEQCARLVHSGKEVILVSSGKSKSVVVLGLVRPPFIIISSSNFVPKHRCSWRWQETFGETGHPTSLNG